MFSQEWTLGLFFILLVALIWTAASIAVQFMLIDMSFNSPFFLTFISNSLFIVYLPLWELLRYLKLVNVNIEPLSLSSRNYFGILYLRHAIMSGVKNLASVFTSTGPRRDFELVDDSECDVTTIELMDLNGGMHQRTTMGSSSSSSSIDQDNDEIQFKTHYEHLTIAMFISPLWFMANLSYNYSL